MKEIKFQDSFLKLVNSVKQDHIKVFDDALTYILRILSIDDADVPWEYSEKENEAFYAFYGDYLAYMTQELKKRPWCDAWGDVYMEMAGQYKSFRGQFFTPQPVSDLVSRICSYKRPEAERFVINDCACGSCRMLLAANEAERKKGNPQPYLIGEDIDGTCCKMAAINLAVHGCLGEVIRHDSLREPDGLSYGYVINRETLPLPTIFRTNDKSYFIKFEL